MTQKIRLYGTDRKLLPLHIACAMQPPAEVIAALLRPDTVTGMSTVKTLMKNAKKKNRIISKTKSKYWTRTHKFGIRLPHSVEEALAIDKENGDTLWWDAICKEMKNVRVAFEEYDGNVKDLVGYKRLHMHMIFDIKMGENFRRKARMVAGGDGAVADGLG